MKKFTVRDQLLKIVHVAEGGMHVLDALDEQMFCSRRFYEEFPERKELSGRVDRLREELKKLAADAYDLVVKRDA